MPPDEAGSLLRFSAIGAALEVTRLRKEHADITEEFAIRQLKTGPSTSATFDYAAGRRILGLLGPEPFLPHPNRGAQLRNILKLLVIEMRPLWGSISTRGREKARLSMDDDCLQCLEYADLFGESDEAIRWWDEIQSSFWQEDSFERLMAGRQAERMTMKYERKRLTSLGRPDLAPTWVAVEDNSAGFDILSYSMTDGMRPSEVFIEVKTGIQRGFFISRYEWNFALVNKEKYRLYFWDVGGGVLRIFDVDQLAPHMPINRGIGLWDKATVDATRIATVELPVPSVQKADRA